MSVVDTIQEQVTHGLINTKDIYVDELGQRDVDRRRGQFNKIMKSFNPLKVNDLKVALIDGKYFCFDGQMTMKVLKARNKGRDLDVPCRIYTGLTMLDVATLFCDQNENKSPVNISDVLRVKSNYGDINAIEFIRYTEKSGVDISWKHIKSRNSITAISTAYNVFLTFKDRNMYATMLSCMKAAWDGLDDAFSAKMLRGMGLFFTTYGGEIDIDRLKKKLAYVRPSEIIRDASIDRSHGARKYAVLILHQYNKGAVESKRLPNKI